MRGKEASGRYAHRNTGITPAYAGKSSSAVCIRVDTGDHPRLCGEKSMFEIGSGSVPGSPPPMRGKVEFRVCGFDRLGITPAYAGKSNCGCTGIDTKGDHPRLCGEKDERDGKCNLATGSPPPMRGKGRYVFLLAAPMRITPAYAGKSQAGSLSHKRIEDHPRLCGEKINIDKMHKSE